jgi:hypothetical protein
LDKVLPLYLGSIIDGFNHLTLLFCCICAMASLVVLRRCVWML